MEVLFALFQLSTMNPTQQEMHLRSSNVWHLQGIMGCITARPEVYNVLQPFHCQLVPYPLVVDVVANHGATWVKVIARKAQALHLIWAGKYISPKMNTIEW